MHSTPPADTPPDEPAAPQETPPQAEPTVPDAATPDAAVEAPEPAAAASPTTDLSPAATGARLAELFPALFVGPDGRGVWKPIKLRIHADIQARAPGQFSKRTLGIFFSRYTTTTAYLKALSAAGAQRMDLDGQPAGEIAEEHRKAAEEEVARRQAIAAERRAAQRRPAAPAADAPERPPRRDARPEGERPPARRPPRAEPRPQRREGAEARAPRHDTRPERRPDQRFEHRPNHHPERRPEPAPAETALPVDPAQRERALLLRSFEASPLSKANFCALKRISEAALDAALAQARQERQPPPRKG